MAKRIGRCSVCGERFPAIRREPRSREEAGRRDTLPIISAAIKPGEAVVGHTTTVPLRDGWHGAPYCKGSGEPAI